MTQLRHRLKRSTHKASTHNIDTWWFVIILEHVLEQGVATTNHVRQMQNMFKHTMQDYVAVC